MHWRANCVRLCRIVVVGDVIRPSANVHESAFLGEQVRVWDLACIRENAELGDRVIVGQLAYVGVGVKVDKDSKIQNGAQIYEPASIGQGVFIGPAVVLTNDLHPRAVTPDLRQKSASDWNQVGVTVLDGASIGAGAICVAPLLIGRWAMVAAGSVVVDDVPDYALVAGNPARQIGWVGRSGNRLLQDADDARFWRCPNSPEVYRQTQEGELFLETGPSK